MNSCGLSSYEVKDFLSKRLSSEINCISPEDLEKIIVAISELIKKNNESIKRDVDKEIQQRLRMGY